MADQLSTGVGGKPATPSTPAPKASSFDAPKQVVKGDGKAYDVGGHNDTYQATSPVEPGFKQRIRSMVTDGSMPGADTGQSNDLAGGIKAAVSGASGRRAAVDKAVSEATQ